MKLMIMPDGSYESLENVRMIEVNDEVMSMLQDGHPVDNLEMDEFEVLKEYGVEEWCSIQS